jgi:hypothetical protein
LRPGQSVTALVGLLASMVATSAHTAEEARRGSDGGSSARAFTAECTRLAEGDLVLVLTPACTAQLGTPAGKSAFQGVVRTHVQALERTKAAKAFGGAAAANLARLGQLAAVDGDPAARRAANYATRQAQPMP